MQSTVLKILIIDDEADAREILSMLLKRHYSKVYQVEMATGVSDGLEKIHSFQPDLIFLDINMRDGSGFNLLDKVGPHFPFKIIFTTSFDEFALKAFRYCALDYLLKPIDVDDFKTAVNKVQHLHQQEHIFQLLETIKQPVDQRRFEKIAVPSSEGIIMIDLKKILRLESDKGYTTFHSVDGKKYTIAKLIGEYEEILPKEYFFRIHVSHIVNINFVEKFLKSEGGKVQMRGGVELPIARRRKDNFIETLKSLKEIWV